MARAAQRRRVPGVEQRYDGDLQENGRALASHHLCQPGVPWPGPGPYRDFNLKFKGLGLGVLYTGNLKSACMCMYALLCSMYLSVYFMYLYVCICIGLYSDNTCMYSVVCACMCMYVNEINKKWLSVERAYLYV